MSRLKISLFHKVVPDQRFCRKSLFWSITDMSGLIISLFPLISARTEIFMEIVILVHSGHACPDWKFHFFPQIFARSKILQEIVISAHSRHVQTENSTFSTNLCLFQDFAGNCHFGSCDMFRLKISLFPTNLCTNQDFAGNSHFGTLWTCPDWKFHFFHKFVPTTHTPHKNPHLYPSSTVGLHTG